MMRLFRIEGLKHTKSVYVWVVSAITILVYALLAFSLRKIFSTFLSSGPMPQGTGFVNQFPHVWYYVPWVLSYFKIFPALLIIYIVGTEYSNRTARQHIIDGMSRNEFVLSKLLMVFTVSFIFMLASMIMAGLSGITSGSSSDASGFYLQFPLLYFYELVCYLLFVMALAFWLRKTLITVFVLVIYGLIVEPIIGTQVPVEVKMWLPLSSISGLVHDPDINTTMFTVAAPLHRPVIDFIRPLIYAGLFLFLSFYRFRKINL